MRSLSRLLGAIALVAALPAHAGIRGTLREPGEGTVLRGGTTAVVSWWAAEMPRHAEEWEAFLSVDGGKYYAYRITPHLDLARRRFTFEVPNVETDGARILLRVGDERNEEQIELPVTFSIRLDPIRAAATAGATVEENHRGEPARPGDRGVIQWIDGDRSGRHLALRTALRQEDALRNAPRIETTSDAAESTGFVFSAEAPSIASSRSVSRRQTAKPQQPTHSADLLLICRRRNI